jgi:hypothetical protein
VPRPGGDHFRQDGFELNLRAADDRNGAYTLAAYDLNEPLKVESRATRWALHEKFLRLVRGIPARRDRLLEAWRSTNDEAFRQAAFDLEELLFEARTALEKYACVPKDAPPSCRCRTHDHHSLPAALAAQCVELPVPEGRIAGEGAPR